MNLKLGFCMALMLLAGGCGGSNSDNGNGGSPPPGGGGPPLGDTTLTLTARDAFGVPVPNATIGLLSSSPPNYREIDAVTDADGRVEVVGSLGDVYAAVVTTTDLWGSSYEPSYPDNDRIQFTVTLHPASALIPGIADLSVTSHAADGRQLEFSARLFVIEGRVLEGADGDYEAWNFGAVNVLPCSPDNSNDATTFTADCVENATGQDAAYHGSTLTQAWVDPNPDPDPLSIALLLDQGASLAVTDTTDRRLLAAKYLQTRLDANDRVALAAFAADDASTAQVALLPKKPVTIFPVDDPSFTTDRESFFSTIDSLAALEGGASPLHAAVGELIGFTAASALANNRRAVVVLASGDVSDCDSAAECQTAKGALFEESAANDVALVAVGLSAPSTEIDSRKLGTFAQAERGAVFWAQDATQVPTAFGRLPEILDGGHGALDVSIRLESPVPGTFASGNTVIGTLHVVICPWDCDASIQVPFALRVP